MALGQLCQSVLTPSDGEIGIFMQALSRCSVKVVLFPEYGNVLGTNSTFLIPECPHHVLHQGHPLPASPKNCALGSQRLACNSRLPSTAAPKSLTRDVLGKESRGS